MMHAPCHLFPNEYNLQANESMKQDSILREVNKVLICNILQLELWFFSLTTETKSTAHFSVTSITYMNSKVTIKSFHY
jgi:hypothetical protein